MAESELTRRWRPDGPWDLMLVLDPLRRGKGDPTSRWTAEACWHTLSTVDGPVTLRVRRAGEDVLVSAWGSGAEWLLDRLPELLGAGDDDADFEPQHDIVSRGRRRGRGLRLCSTGRVWDALVPAVLEQKVTNREAWRTWRELCQRYGSPAPGPAPEGLRVLPEPARVRAIRDWEWHRIGLDGARRRTLIAAATVAHRLEKAAELGGLAGQQLLRHVPGIGPWTTAEIAQRVWGDPDAVSVGDVHLPTIVGLALTGEPQDDEGMVTALEPYAGHRHRVVRYLGIAGVQRPRFGPRAPVRDYRAM